MPHRSRNLRGSSQPAGRNRPLRLRLALNSWGGSITLLPTRGVSWQERGLALRRMYDALEHFMVLQGDGRSRAAHAGRQYVNAHQVQNVCDSSQPGFIGWQLTAPVPNGTLMELLQRAPQRAIVTALLWALVGSEQQFFQFHKLVILSPQGQLIRPPFS